MLLCVQPLCIQLQSKIYFAANFNLWGRLLKDCGKVRHKHIFSVIKTPNWKQYTDYESYCANLPSYCVAFPSSFLLDIPVILCSSFPVPFHYFVPAQLK